MTKTEFVGLDALKEISERGPSLRRVGMILEGRRIARENSPVLHNGNEVGHVTSGSFSPTLDQVIAMAYVPFGLSEPGTALSISIRGSLVGAKVVPLPFYRRAR
ncbi:MAG: glycine cleavage T C-terminal barrel domain-containing protein [Phycisphaerae bacterium]